MPNTDSRKKGSVLVIDDRENMLKMMTSLLQDEFAVRTAGSGEGGIRLFEREPADVVVTDIRMPDVTGMDVLRAVKKQSAETEVILMTAYAEVAQAVEALRAGAYDYVIKPFEPEEMVLAIQKALERKLLRERTAHLEREVGRKFGFAGIVSESKVMSEAVEMARKAAASDATVLLSGESGTGKELFARAIHYASARRSGRFVAVNCAAIPTELIESELFGHVKGSFTGATRDKPGLFEEASGGTLLLDEITELAPDMQAKINRALQEKEVRRVGDTQDRSVDVRIIAATNRDVQKAIHEGGFREDLYFRLNVLPIRLPPLREREGDLPLLIRQILDELTEGRADRYRIEPEAMQKLLAYSWPGNVRELHNAIERAAVLSEDGLLTAGMFVLGERVEVAAGGAGVPVGMAYKEAMKLVQDRSQKEYLVAVLKKFGGNVTRAADYAGIERESFHRLMRKCGVSSDDLG